MATSMEAEDDGDGSTPPFKRGVCATHSTLLWFKKNHGLFKTHNMPTAAKDLEAKKGVAAAMVADFKLAEDSPFPNLEKGVIHAMREKWRNERGEDAVEEAWGKAWDRPNVHLLRANLNEMGGTPNDNNGLEGCNGHQKQAFGHERFSLGGFIRNQHKWLSDESAEDVAMSVDMGFARAKGVWDTDFFESVVNELDKFEKKEGFFNARFTRQVGDLTVTDIPSRRIITVLTEQMGMNNVKKDDVAKLKLALTHSQPCNGRNCDMCEDSWLHTYRELSVATLLDNGMLPDHLEMEFDVLTDFLTAFHTLKPISDKIYVTNLINRLRESKMGLNLNKICSSQDPPNHTFELDDTKMRKFGFCSCNCGTYLHKMWCLHVTVDAMLKGLITTIPPNVSALYHSATALTYLSKESGSYLIWAWALTQ